MRSIKFSTTTVTAVKLLLPIYFFLSVLAMFPASFHMTTYKYGYAYNGSDSLGTMSYNWSIVQHATFNGNGELWTYYQGYPVGRKLMIHEPMRLLACLATKIVNPVFGYNIIVFLSFLLAGLFTHLLMFRFLNDHWISLFGGFIFMFSPFHIIQASDHFNLAQTWIFPAFFLLIMNALSKKTYQSCTYVLFFILFTLLIHGYYAVYLGFILVSLLIYLLITRTIIISRKQVCFMVSASLVIMVFALCVLYYMGMITLKNGGISFYTRSIKDLYTFGIRWYEFLLPPYYSLLFKDVVRAFISKHHHGSNYAELTLFIGYIPLLLCGYLGYGLVKKKPNTPPVKKSGDSIVFAHIEKQYLIMILIIGLIPFFLGVQPEIDVFGFKIPTLSKLVFYMLPMIRTLSRIGVLTIFTATCFASFGLYFLVKKFPKYRKLIVVMLIFGVFLEFTQINEGYYADTSNVPQVYQAVKKIKGDVVIFERPFKWGYMPDFWQTYHNKPLFNFFGTKHPNFKEALILTKSSKLSELITCARQLHIDYIILHLPDKLPLKNQFKNKLNKHSILPRNAVYSYLIKVN